MVNLDEENNGPDLVKAIYGPDHVEDHLKQ